ncbi:histidine phosphatase family protein [Salipaludibacillus daqingensis]|uniref:histidine phosphatase family protein n=1 Tax=Salipaludibacillus daqingensis TaxID=3041001 RepID=UPI002474E770|nr:histidine phosphatase family protein [Salipaludibacillus daqingensis]
MINQSHKGNMEHPEQLADYYQSQATYYERLKNGSKNNLCLYYQYGEQEYYNKALACRYKMLTAEASMPKNQSPNDRQGNIPDHDEELATRSLLSSLREGGYIFYARHGEATVGVDQADSDLQDCATQRNLSETGRRQAVTYGEGFRNLDIPVQFPVETSPFCRSIETANLAFGQENVRVEPFWFQVYRLFENITFEEQQRIIQQVDSVLETSPSQGTNTLIIAHSFPEGVGLGQIPNMGTVIVRPLGQGNGYEVVAKLTLRGFTDLQE